MTDGTALGTTDAREIALAIGLTPAETAAGPMPAETVTVTAAGPTPAETATDPTADGAGATATPTDGMRLVTRAETGAETTDPGATRRSAGPGVTTDPHGPRGDPDGPGNRSRSRRPWARWRS